MKVTYLIRKIQPDGTFRLELGTKAELHEVMESNKGLPTDQRRYFISDYIADGRELDCIIMEVPIDMYRKHNREHMASERIRKANMSYIPVPFEGFIVGEENILIEDTLTNDYLLDEAVISNVFIEELRVALSAWKPWASEMLDIYLNGEKKCCTKLLAVKYHVSEQVIRKYKRQFEDFIKKYFTGVSF